MAHKPGSYIAVPLTDGRNAACRVMPGNHLEVLDLAFTDNVPTLDQLRSTNCLTTLWVTNLALSPRKTKRIAHAADGVVTYVRPPLLWANSRGMYHDRGMVNAIGKWAPDVDWWVLEPDGWCRPLRTPADLELEQEVSYHLPDAVDRIERILSGDRSDHFLAFPNPWIDPELLDRPRWRRGF